MSDDLDASDLHHDTVRALMAGVRKAVDRMKSRLPDHVDPNDVVSAGYLALTQALAYWQDDGEETLEVHAMKRATAAMLAAAGREARPTDLSVSAEHARPESADTIVSPPRASVEPERRSEVATHSVRDVALIEIGVRVA